MLRALAVVVVADLPTQGCVQRCTNANRMQGSWWKEEIEKGMLRAMKMTCGVHQ